MGFPIMVLGESGSGKSTSLRNFKAEDIGIINVSGKPLPFKSPEMAKKCRPCDNMAEVQRLVVGSQANTIVIDDAQYLMANQFMRSANVSGFQKFTDIQKGFWDIVQAVLHSTPAHKLVYFMMHIERSANGEEKAKTIGKLLDEKITLEGMFTVVLKTVAQDGKYFFSTRNSRMDTVKSPIGMFDESLIDNDLLYVDTVIRAYYELPMIEERKPAEAPKEASA